MLVDSADDDNEAVWCITHFYPSIIAWYCFVCLPSAHKLSLCPFQRIITKMTMAKTLICSIGFHCIHGFFLWNVWKIYRFYGKEYQLKINTTERIKMDKERKYFDLALAMSSCLLIVFCWIKFSRRCKWLDMQEVDILFNVLKNF